MPAVVLPDAVDSVEERVAAQCGAAAGGLVDVVSWALVSCWEIFVVKGGLLTVEGDLIVCAH